ncbi:hypothetical protein HFP67_13150 [Bacillus sp. CB102A.1]
MKKKLLAIALGTSVVFALGACGNKEEIIKKGRGSMSPGLIQGEDAKKVSEWLAEHK